MKFVPKDEKFYDLFEELACKIEEGGKLFMDILNNYEYSEPKLTKLKEIEHEADEITHRAYERMHKTFLTPLDREDIYALVNKMDSILDMIEASAVRMYLYKVKTPAEELFVLMRILTEAIAKVKMVVHAPAGQEELQDDPRGLRGDQHAGKRGGLRAAHGHGPPLRAREGPHRTDQVEGNIRADRGIHRRL